MQTKIMLVLVFLLLSAFSSLLFYVKSLRAENESLQVEINIAFKANEALKNDLLALQIRHEAELKAIESVTKANTTQRKRIKELQNYVKNSAETNNTKLFNDVVSGLFEHENLAPKQDNTAKNTK